MTSLNYVRLPIDLNLCNLPLMIITPVARLPERPLPLYRVPAVIRLAHRAACSDNVT